MDWKLGGEVGGKGGDREDRYGRGERHREGGVEAGGRWVEGDEKGKGGELSENSQSRDR